MLCRSSRKIVQTPKTAKSQFGIGGISHSGEKMNMYIQDGSIFATGMPGCGKTFLLNLLISQTSEEKNAIHIIFDVKGDYLRKFRADDDYVLSVEDIDGIPKKCHKKWDLMSEVRNSKDPEMFINEFCANMFSGISEHHSQPFFPEAAQKVFRELLKYYYRTTKGEISNKKLFDKIKEMDIDAIHNALMYGNTADGISIKNLLPKKAVNTYEGVLAEMHNTIDRCFSENYCSDESDFSIKDFIRNGQGRKLFIEYSFEHKQSSENIIKLLLDIAMQESLGRRDKSSNIYFYLDEFATLPTKLNFIRELSTVGRGLNVRVVACTQSISQLYDVYGEYGGQALLSGFATYIAFKSNDENSIRYAVDCSGEEYVLVTHMHINRRQPVTVTERMPIVSREMISELHMGEIIVIPFAYNPYYFRIVSLPFDFQESRQT